MEAVPHTAEQGTPASASTLRAENLTLGHGGRPVLTGVHAELTPGGVTALVGANGSGKSTLLRTLARLHQADCGAVLLDGRDVTGVQAKAFARELAMLSQAPQTPEAVQARDVVELGRYPHQGLLGRTTADDREAVAWALRVTGLEELADRPVTRLSGGERQRVWIAMALAQRAKVLLLDEPTTFLDLRYQVEVLELIRDLADLHGITVGVVLHDLNQAAAWSDQMVMLAHGRILAAGPPECVLTAELVREAFGLDVGVVTDPGTGLPTCLPYRRRVHGRTA